MTINRGFTPDQGGLGYAVFAIAMTVGRLTGDRVIRRWGRKRVMTLGGLSAAAGFFTATLAPASEIALVGFLLIGVGASNIAPILFTAAGRQQDMPAAAAISAVTTLGYAGILAGPALIGFVAHARQSRTHGEPFGASGRSALVSPRFGKCAAPVVVSTLQFSQQLREQLHASVPALAHTVYSGGEAGYLSLARLMRHPS